MNLGSSWISFFSPPSGSEPWSEDVHVLARDGLEGGVRAVSAVGVATLSEAVLASTNSTPSCFILVLLI